MAKKTGKIKATRIYKSTAQQNKLSVSERLKRRAEGTVQREAMKRKLAAQKKSRASAKSKRTASGNAGLRKKYGGLTGIRQDMK